MTSLSLLLADGRFPAGGHAHSGGVEAAVDDGRLDGVDTLLAFLRGRLAVAGRVAAMFAAAAATGRHDIEDLDREMAARMSSPALRRASRQQGRQLLRAATAVLPRLPRLPDELHHAVAIGTVARAVSVPPVDAARWAAYESIAGAASAAIRLLGLDPFATWRAVASLTADIDEMAAESAALAAVVAIDRLPACAAPLLDRGAERHAAKEGRLFAS